MTDQVQVYLVLSWRRLEEVAADDPPRNTGLGQIFVDRKQDRSRKQEREK